MFDRFRKGVIPAETGDYVFADMAEAVEDVWDGEDGDNAELIGEHAVDPELVRLHELEMAD